MNATAGTARSVIWRGIGLLALWIVVAGAEPANLPVGIAFAALAAWGSLALLAPSDCRIRFVPLLQFALRLGWDSVLAGADVAARALSPRLRIAPGFIHYRPDIETGAGRSLFATVMSLVPGTLPAGTEPDGTLVVHCLDINEPVAASIRREEAKWRHLCAGGGTGG